ncbi:MAG TPA: hypothetical protein VK179_16650 [Bacteroidales bacterium]|nr:hypothetical protein [Bacteroidales bacterium]
MTKLRYLFTVCLILFVVSAYSQPAPARYGKIDMADLEMKTYPLDTTAEAVILCDYGVFNDNTFDFTRLLRIKILKKEGSYVVNRAYPITGTGSIKGCTYNLVNGEIVESKLKSESIFRETIRDDYYRYRVTMPDVRAGSVVEIQYTYPYLPYEWSFQDVVPVRWSELRIAGSPIFTFQKVFFGFEPFYINEPGRWATKDLPAMRPEPFVNSMNNYMNRVEIEVQSITVPGYLRYFTTSWDAVNLYLDQHKSFGMATAMGTFMNDVTRNIKNLDLSPEKKMKAACDSIKRRIKWNEQESLLSTAELAYSYRKGSGNSADINLTLVQLLKKLDFTAFPIALSTRENGILSPAFPSINKLNYVIAGVNYNGKTYLFDATDRCLPSGMLPFRALNGRGRIIKTDMSDWIDLTPTAEEKQSVYFEMKLDENGEMSGKATYTKTEYAGYYLRDALRKHNSQDEYIKEKESQNPGLIINSFSFENLDSLQKPVQEIYDMSITGFADIIGDMISVSPMLFEKLTSNPFKMEKRKYPIDYGHQIKKRFIINLTLPDGYEVSEIPSPLALSLPSKSARFTYNTIVNNNTVQMICNFEIAKIIFTESEYDLVKEFYNQVIAKEAEVIMLKKKN